jgi:hypothetical protein
VFSRAPTVHLALPIRDTATTGPTRRTGILEPLRLAFLAPQKEVESREPGDPQDSQVTAAAVALDSEAL